MQPPAPDPLLVVGIGCRSGCAALQLLELVESGLHELGLETGAIRAVASIDLKGEEPGLLALAKQLQVPLILLSAITLLPYEAQLTHRSALAYARTGCHGVAESAALAAASQLARAPARLLITRRQSAHATFALAGAVVEG
ncbi:MULTISPECIES: cobalamin biosynthesis protein [unclassified Pseudomonas]|uniref:cobalamin biosynthesis protein n=1 Tax=Pseudomonas sp. R1-18 TaxID=1632772 RepID=UPI003DA8C820